MMVFKRCRFARRAFVATLLAATAATAAAQGTVTGQITSDAGLPVADATVLVLGTSIAATTGQDGPHHRAQAVA